MAVPRNPVTIDTSDTFSTWLSNTNLAIDILKNIITDTVLTHPSASAFTAGSTITQATTGASGIVQVSTTEATTLSDLGTGTWGTSNNVTQSSPTSVTVSASDLDAVSTSHLATTNAVLTTPTLTAPVIATITNNGNTLTLPTSADVIVGRATTDTLTNKTLTGPVISGGSLSGVTITNNAIGSAPTISVDDGGTIGSDSDADAIAIGADGDVTLTQDLELQHDGAILSFGANDEVTLTHVHDTGLLLNGTMQIQFNDSSQFINAPSNAILDINATDEIELNATLIDVNGNLDVSGTVTTGGNITIPNGGNVGSVGDTDAIAIASGGVVTFSQRDVHSAGITVSAAASFSADVTLTQDLELQHDGAILKFGANDDVTITHVADVGLIIRNTVGSYTQLAIHASDTDVGDGDLLGEIIFVAPAEASADGDNNLPAAAIAARSEGDFSNTSNATELVFKTGVSETAAIGSADGDVIIRSTGALYASKGIEFPSTFSNNTNANTLDDYEEGTWTPDMPDGGGETSISGRYVKIGRQVIATAFIDTNTTADYSNFKLTGLPFTILDDDCCGFVSMTSVTTYNYDDATAPRFFYLTKNTDYIQGWSVSGDALEHSGRNNEVYRGQDIMFQAVYETAS